MAAKGKGGYGGNAQRGRPLSTNMHWTPPADEEDDEEVNTFDELRKMRNELLGYEGEPAARCHTVCVIEKQTASHSTTMSSTTWSGRRWLGSETVGARRRPANNTGVEHMDHAESVGARRRPAVTGVEHMEHAE
jgi:hypothetical protein